MFAFVKEDSDLLAFSACLTSTTGAGVRKHQRSISLMSKGPIRSRNRHIPLKEQI
jgi:hypothetical protein